jgi:hypothetical protein
MSKRKAPKHHLTNKDLAEKKKAKWDKMRAGKKFKFVPHPDIPKTMIEIEVKD